MTLTDFFTDSPLWVSIPITLRSFRAHFEVPEENPVRSFVLDFGDETSSMHNAECIMHNEADAWYDMQGCKLDNVPTKKGVYIYKGKKVKKVKR